MVDGRCWDRNYYAHLKFVYLEFVFAYTRDRILYCFFIFSLLRDYFFSFLSLRFLNVELNYRTNLRFRAAWLAFVRILKSRNARRVCIRGCRLKSTERFNNKNKQFACLAPEMLLLYVLALNFTLARKYTIYILRIISKNFLLSVFFLSIVVHNGFYVSRGNLHESFAAYRKRGKNPSDRFHGRLRAFIKPSHLAPI